jgi:hypothetical protein
MANRLLRYEAALFRRSFADAFGHPRDLALLAAMLLIAGLWLRGAIAEAGPPAMPPEAVWLALAAAPVALAWQRLAGRRLAWLAEHSALAPAALEAHGRRLYLMAAHLIVVLPLAAGAALLGIATGRLPLAAALAVAAYGVGVALVPLGRDARGAPRREVPPRDSAAISAGGGSAVLAAILRRQSLAKASPMQGAALLVGAILLLTAAAAWFGRAQPEAVRIAAMILPSFLALLLTSRVDSGLIGFLPYAGYRPGFIAFAVSALPLAGYAAAAGAVLALGGADRMAALLVLTLIHAAFILIGIVRAWLYPGRDGRSVDVQVQIEFAGLVLIAFLLPPLALLAIGWRLWRLHRHCRAQRWILL